MSLKLKGSFGPITGAMKFSKPGPVINVDQTDLILYHDYSQTECYPGTNTIVNNLIGNVPGALEGSPLPTFHPATDSFYYGGSGTPNIKPNSIFAVPVNTFTFSIWCKPSQSTYIPGQTTSGINQLSGWRKLCTGGDGSGTNTGFELSVGTNGIAVIEHKASTHFSPITRSISISSTNWTNIVITYTNGIPNLYINGAWIKTGAQGSGSTAMGLTSIGYGSYGSFAGNITMISAYSRALDGTDVLSNYDADKTRYGH